MEPARKPRRHHDDEAFWDELARGVEALQADPEAWAAYRAEVALWDRATADGLDRE